MEIVAVIPARFASTRLPGKPLLSETGRPLIQHVVEAARQAQSLDRIIVATDDQRIADAVAAFGGEAMMTRSDHPTGTDRVAEVAARIEKAAIIVNVQGDEPELAGEHDRSPCRAPRNDPEAPMATLATPIRDDGRLSRPSCVKVVCSRRSRALYFSRSPIPFHRDGLPGPVQRRPIAHLHLGLYAYRRDFLLSIGDLPRFSAGSRREARAASRARSRLSHRDRHRRRAERRHRYAGGLPAVRRAVPEKAERALNGTRERFIRPSGLPAREPGGFAAWPRQRLLQGEGRRATRPSLLSRADAARVWSIEPSRHGWLRGFKLEISACFWRRRRPSHGIRPVRRRVAAHLDPGHCVIKQGTKADTAKPTPGEGLHRGPDNLRRSRQLNRTS